MNFTESYKKIIDSYSKNSNDLDKIRDNYIKGVSIDMTALKTLINNIKITGNKIVTLKNKATKEIFFFGIYR